GGGVEQAYWITSQRIGTMQAKAQRGSDEPNAVKCAYGGLRAAWQRGGKRKDGAAKHNEQRDKQECLAGPEQDGCGARGFCNGAGRASGAADGRDLRPCNRMGIDGDDAPAEHMGALIEIGGQMHGERFAAAGFGGEVR